MNSTRKSTNKIRRFTDLDAWKQGHIFTLLIYNIVKSFPADEIFGLTSQMRRAAVSVTSNIAEGVSRQSYKEKVRFYYIAQGSVTELQNQLFLAHDIGYISKREFNSLAEQSLKFHKIINGLIKKSKTIIHNH